MKILLLNQPVYNRGDEAAHRSLIRTLNKNEPKHPAISYGTR